MLTGGAQKSLCFLQLQSFTHLSKKERKDRKFSFPDTFSSCELFLSDGGKWVNVIPFLMVEQANLLTPLAIVDRLSDGRGGR